MIVIRSRRASVKCST